jgi:hypothetical protein
MFYEINKCVWWYFSGCVYFDYFLSHESSSFFMIVFYPKNIDFKCMKKLKYD